MLLSGALIGAGWFGLFVVGHVALVAWWRQERRSNMAGPLFGLALAGAVVTAALGPLTSAPWASPGGYQLIAVIGALVTLACGFVLYMPAYYTVVSSLSGQILVRLDGAEAGRLPLTQLASSATYREIVTTRLDSMVSSGLLTETDGAYRATAKGQRTARLFLALKSVWRLGPGG